MQIHLKIKRDPRTRLTIIFCLWALMASMAASTNAQSVCLPLPRLLTIVPMGGQVGTQVHVTISAEYAEEISALLFNHTGITASAQLDAANQPIANQFVVTIADDCPPGLYEARILSRLGVSSARIFSVGELPETIQQTGNISLTTAQDLPVNSVCNAVATEKAINFYRFSATAGQRFVIHCLARGIDSKMDPVIVVADESGVDLVVNRQGDTIDFVAPQTGHFLIKVHELTFRGGPAFFYRLVLESIDRQAVWPQFPTTRTVSSFSWPPQGLAPQAAMIENEPNHQAETAQRVTLPVDIHGQFFPAADVDVFEFVGRQGESWWIEVASERLGRPTDPQVLVQLVRNDGGVETLSDVLELSDIPSPMKPSSNGYAYDGPPYDGGSLDVLGKLDLKEDGVYRLTVTDLFGGTRSDARNVYRLVIRQAAPDFALAAWGLHMELRNGDRNALSKPLALRAGSTVALEVVVVRRDGFDGEIELEMNQLPAGVTAAGLKIPAGKSRGVMLLTADPGAPGGFSEATFVGRSTVNGQEVVRPVHMAQMAWPIADSWGEIPSPRLVSGIPVTVTTAELAPLTIRAQEAKEVFEVVSGQTLKIPLALQRRSEFSGSVLQLKTLGVGFENNPPFDVSLTSDSAEAVLHLGTLQTPPGDYLLTFYGAAVAQYQYNPGATATAPQDTVDIVLSTPIAIRVTPGETP